MKEFHFILFYFDHLDDHIITFFFILFIIIVVHINCIHEWVAVKFLHRCALIPSTLWTPLSPSHILILRAPLHSWRETVLTCLSVFILFWLIHCLQDVSIFFLQMACFSYLCTVVLPFMSTLSYSSAAWLYPACCEQRCSNRHYTGISECRRNLG